MEKQEIINAISVLNNTVGATVMAGDHEATKRVISKILELIKQL